MKTLWLMEIVWEMVNVPLKVCVRVFRFSQGEQGKYKPANLHYMLSYCFISFPFLIILLGTLSSLLANLAGGQEIIKQENQG